MLIEIDYKNVDTVKAFISVLANRFNFTDQTPKNPGKKRIGVVPSRGDIITMPSHSQPSQVFFIPDDWRKAMNIINKHTTPSTTINGFDFWKGNSRIIKVKGRKNGINFDIRKEEIDDFLEKMDTFDIESITTSCGSTFHFGQLKKIQNLL